MNLSTGSTQQSRLSYPMDFKSKANETDFDNHLHLNSDLHSSGENQQDSEYVESMMICNEVDIEDELNKAQNEPESVFKMLSISFYDKSMSSRPAKENTYSRLHLTESNKTFAAPTQFQAIKSIGKGNGRPRLVTRNVSWNNDKAANEELARAYAKPKLKLFSIKERPSKDLSSPLLTSKKADMRLSLGNSLSGRISPQIPFRDSSKEDRVLALFQNPGQFRKGSLTQCLSPTNKVNTPDTKINTLVRLYSPKPTVKRSNSKQRVNENHNNSHQLSPRARTGKLLGSPTALGSATLERNRLEYKLDVQRISFNDVRYSPALMDSLNKGSGTPQHKTCESPRRYSNLVKNNFTKGYAYSKPQKKNTAAVRLDTDTSAHKSPKLWLKPELRIKTEENEKPKSNLRSLLSHPQSTKNQRKNSKDKLLNWSALHHRESSPSCNVNETENIKSNLKLRPKVPL